MAIVKDEGLFPWWDLFHFHKKDSESEKKDVLSLIEKGEYHKLTYQDIVPLVDERGIKISTAHTLPRHLTIVMEGTIVFATQSRALTFIEEGILGVRHSVGGSSALFNNITREVYYDCRKELLINAIKHGFNRIYGCSHNKLIDTKDEKNKLISMDMEGTLALVEDVEQMKDEA